MSPSGSCPVRVSVVIPTRNEEDAIGRVLDDLPRALVREVIVVDGASTDRTREIAEGRGARVVEVPMSYHPRIGISKITEHEPAAGGHERYRNPAPAKLHVSS